MSRIPRDISGIELARLLGKLNYKMTRQKGSHLRLERISEEGKHSITISANDPLKIGTFHAILKDIAQSLKITKTDLIDRLF